MTSRSDPFVSGDTGVSLIEVLVVLAILAGLAGLAAGGLQSPSPLLIARGEAADVQREAAETRLRAVRTGMTITVDLPSVACAPGEVSKLVFHPDGTMKPVRLCFGDGPDLVLVGDVLSGSLRHEKRD